MKIRIMEEVGKLAVSAEEGSRVAALAANELERGQQVVLDFEGVEIASTTFLNHAIGTLFAAVDAQRLKGLRYESVTQDVEHRIGRVVENARRYYSDDSYRIAVDTATEAVAAGM